MYILGTQRVKKHRKVRRILALAAIAVLGLGMWQTWVFLQPHYRIWKQRRAMNQARDFIEKRDIARAQIALEVAMTTIPGNPDALRLAADMLEQVGSPQSIRFRRAVARILPDSAEDAAALVMTSLRFQDVNSARDALSSVSTSVASQPPALRAAVAFALATDNSPIADILLEKLKVISPKDEDVKFMHALLLLKHPKPEKQAEARKTLDQIIKDKPELAIQVYREMIGHAMQQRNYEEARKWLELVHTNPRASFQDRLQLANVELLIDKKPFDSVFAQVAGIAIQNPKDVTSFAQWLMVQDRAQEADKWMKQLPEKTLQEPEVKSIQADLAARLQDWNRLGRLLESGAWGPITPETVSLAMAARTVGETSRADLRKDAWGETLNSANNQLSSLRVLYKLASLWRWDDEIDQTLWKIARSYPDQTWAHQLLFNSFRSKGDTAGLREVMGVLRAADVSTPRYQHDWALLTLLSEPTRNMTYAKDVMRRLHETEPSNATYTTGYALSLAQMGKASDALELIQGLSEADRNFIPRQPFLAYIYGLNHMKTEFLKAKALAKDARYLPEEEKLFSLGNEELQRP